MRFVLKLIITAVVFAVFLPMIPGIDFHGNFLAAILLAFFFGIMLWLVDLLAVTISAMLTISSLGLALLFLIPLWLLGFWILPAVALKWVADFFPNYLTVTTWGAAILGSLLILLVGVITSSFGKLIPKNDVA
jgi:uncharacterized membrane protein YvlD (DUF360 family)